MEYVRSLPANPSMTKFFRNLTDRAARQVKISSDDISAYLADLLVDFSHSENLYRFKEHDVSETDYLSRMIEQASEAQGEEKRDYYRQVGDHTLFVLGMVPKQWKGGISSLLEPGYSFAGQQCYFASSQLEPDPHLTEILREMGKQYRNCVASLKWVRKYISDPFYRYMFREFGVT